MAALIALWLHGQRAVTGGGARMGTFLRIIGAGWAILGVGNVLLSLGTPEGARIGVFVLMFNFLLFVLPGAIVYGMGALMRRRAAPDAPKGETRKCPFCAETILKEAKVCRFCQRELAAAETVSA